MGMGMGTTGIDMGIDMGIDIDMGGRWCWSSGGIDDSQSKGSCPGVCACACECACGKVGGREEEEEEEEEGKSACEGTPKERVGEEWEEVGGEGSGEGEGKWEWEWGARLGNIVVPRAW